MIISPFESSPPHSCAGEARPSSNGVMFCMITFPCNMVNLSPREVSPTVSSLGKSDIAMAWFWMIINCCCECCEESSDCSGTATGVSCDVTVADDIVESSS